MTELHEIIERAKKEWESTVDVIADGVALYERHTLEILRVNWPLANFFGITPHKLVKSNIHSLICGCQEPACPILALLISASEDFLEIEQKQKNAQWELSTFPIQTESEGTQRNAIVIRDITQEREWQRRSSQGERNVSMLRTIANQAQQIDVNLLNIKTNLETTANWIPSFRNAFVDYRVALQTQGETAEIMAGLTWEAIEDRHNVEFILQDLEQLLRQSTGQIDEILAALQHLSSLRAGELNCHPADFNALIENAIHSIWVEFKKSVPIERYYGRLPLVQCDALRMQTAITDLLEYLVQTFQDRAELKLVTRLTGKQVQLYLQIIPVKANQSTQPAIEFPELWVEGELRARLGAVISTVTEHQGQFLLPGEAPPPFHFNLSLAAADMN